MRLGGAVATGVAVVLTGCIYYNAIYNAERLLDEGEALRRAGRDSLATDRYLEVIRKASGGFREDPDGEWAGPALLLIGRAHLGLGDLRAARVALERADQVGRDEQVRLAARLYLGATVLDGGDADGAIRLLDEAVAGLAPGRLLAEAHLWRGRARLAAGDAGGGAQDLAAAATMDPGLGLAVELETVRFGLEHDDRARVRAAMSRLLALPEGGELVDSVAWLTRRAEDAWGAADAVDLLAALDGSRWPPAPRSRLRLVRAELLDRAGDTARARAELERVAAGRGPAAVTARVRMARARLADAKDLVEARAALPVLLPAAESAEAAELIGDLQEMQRLAELGLTEPLGWFAAAETARDRLGAGALARGLFLAYADGSPTEPWMPKALLAALDMTPDEGGRAWLRGRLEGRAESPYVLAARGQPAPGLEELEEELARRLQEIRSR